MSIFTRYQEKFDKKQSEEYTIEKYLTMCKEDSSVYATAAERMLAAIGKPKIVDTRKDERLSRIYSNRKIKMYESFSDFYGTEEAIEQIVSFYKHAAQGLEES